MSCIETLHGMLTRHWNQFTSQGCPSSRAVIVPSGLEQLRSKQQTVATQSSVWPLRSSPDHPRLSGSLEAQRYPILLQPSFQPPNAVLCREEILYTQTILHHPMHPQPNHPLFFLASFLASCCICQLAPSNSTHNDSRL
jgi:hypothetical protein